MAGQRRYDVRLAPLASEDIFDIWEWSVERFGQAAALRYEALIYQAIRDIANDPQRAGSKLRSDLHSGIWIYHLDFSRENVEEDQVVKSARHFVAFRYVQPDVIEVVRILHDRRDLGRHFHR